MEREYKTPKSYLLKVLRPLLQIEAYQGNIYRRQESITVGFEPFLCYTKLILETMALIIPSYSYKHLSSK
jgi:hypothetical protein